MIDWNLIRDRAHAQAVKSGWWDDGDRPLDEVLMLIVSEIAEATECVRKGHALFYYDGLKPEGEAVELADACIRIADYCGRRAWSLAEDALFDTHPSCESGGLLFHFELVELLCHKLDHHGAFGFFLHAVEAWANRNEIDLGMVIEKKMTYNATRPRKHGKLL